MGRLRPGACTVTNENSGNSPHTVLHLLWGSVTGSLPILKMPPRFRATPRRGRHAGNRGGTGGRGRSPPRRVSPLSTAYPATQASEDSETSLNNSVQTAKFRFKNRLDRPTVTAMVTVIFSEEEEEHVSSKNLDGELSPTPLEDSMQEEDTTSAQSASASLPQN